MTASEASRRAAEEIVNQYNAGFVWDEDERYANRPALKRFIAEALDTAIARAVAEAVAEKDEIIAAVQANYDRCFETLRLANEREARAVEGEREEIAWLENAVASGHFHHKKWEPRCPWCVAALTSAAGEAK